MGFAVLTTLGTPPNGKASAKDTSQLEARWRSSEQHRLMRMFADRARLA